MKLKNIFSAAFAAGALVYGVSGAQAQYAIAPPVAGGQVFVMPYYAPAFAVTPTINYGAPYIYDPFSFGNFGYSDSVYGYGYPTSFGYPVNGYNGPFAAPSVVTGVGPVEGSAPLVLAPDVTPTVVAPGAPVNEVPDANVNGTEIPNNSAASNAPNSTRYYRSAATAANIITARRAPYNHVAISYNGSTAGVTGITVMLLDSHRRELQQQVLTSAPARTQMRRSPGARYYRVILDYGNGTERTFTRPLSGQ